ncbi:MAG: hypothetical protein NTY53_03810 [Kiritimatiellaeota bacterium]|nr:hypothetical protein [Kiritimatiellota bacterium]
MKKAFTLFCLMSGSFGTVLYLCVWAQHEHELFGSSMGGGGLLLWPAILLARTGMERTWLLLPIVALVLFTLLAWRLRTKRIVIAAAISLALPIAYCWLGAFVFCHVAIPLPTVTPYDTDATKKQEYLDSFSIGYRTGIAGTLRTYCFAPEHTTRGFYEGMGSGLEIFWRCLGIKNTRTLINRSAARDGVVMKPTSAPSAPKPP